MGGGGDGGGPSNERVVTHPPAPAQASSRRAAGPNSRFALPHHVLSREVVISRPFALLPPRSIGEVTAANQVPNTFGRRPITKLDVRISRTVRSSHNEQSTPGVWRGETADGLGD